MFAFIKTLPPVEGRVRDHDIRFPFNVRLALGGWKFLYLDGRRFLSDPNRPAEWNRGAYLVSGPGHCAECHSPRNLLGGIVEDKRFTGGPNPEGEGTIPNITQHALKDYSEKDIVEILTTGMNPEGDSTGDRWGAVVKYRAATAVGSHGNGGLRQPLRHAGQPIWDPSVTKRQTSTRPFWMRRIAIIVLVLTTVPTVLFGVRTYSSLQLLRSAYEAGAPLTSSIRPWMTLKFVATHYRIPEAS
jgi:mono/diheme cytochrome c family protein